MQWTINVVIQSAVPLMCDLEVLSRIGINYSGTTYKACPVYALFPSITAKSWSC